MKFSIACLLAVAVFADDSDFYDDSDPDGWGIVEPTRYNGFDPYN